MEHYFQYEIESIIENVNKSLKCFEYNNLRDKTLTFMS